MIASCPSCHARYKVADSKIKGRGAKISCPKCSHKFTVYKEPANEPVPDVGALDFRRVSIVFKAQRGIGITIEFNTLDQLREHLSNGRLDAGSRITYDQRIWTPIDAIVDLDAWFHDVYKRAERGEIQLRAPAPERDEDAADAPTTIVGRGSSLASEIRMAVSAEATPPPAVARGNRPPPIPSDPGPLSMGSEPSEPPPPPREEEPSAAPSAPSQPVVPDLPPPAPIQATPALVQPERLPPPRPPPVVPPAPEARSNAALWVAAAVILALGALAVVYS